MKHSRKPPSPKDEIVLPKQWSDGGQSKDGTVDHRS